MSDPASLKIKIRAGAYPRTADTVEQILRSTLKILMNEGYAALSLRRVASDCGVSIGNLTYHFPSKAMLLKELLEAVLEAYADRGRQMAWEFKLDDRTALKAGLFNVLRDVQSFQTTHLFPELWSLANHDEEISALLHDFYRRLHLPLIARIRRMNPRLNEADAETVAVFISSFVEGSTIFAGHGKPHARQMPDLAAIATMEGLMVFANETLPDSKHMSRLARFATEAVLQQARADRPRPLA